MGGSAANSAARSAAEPAKDEGFRQALWLGALALLVGAPLYLLTDVVGVLPVAWRDRPWPLELAAAAACLLSLWAAMASSKRRVFALAVPSLVIATTLVLSQSARLLVADLPEPDAELPVGSPLPALELSDDVGAKVSLRATDGTPTVLVFFRAASCPYCRRQLQEIVAVAPRFLDAGVRIVGLCPDDGPLLARLRDELDVPFPLLSDNEERAVSLLCGGRSHCQILADGEGIIRWAGLSETWSDVPPASTVLQAAYRLRR